MGIIRADIQIKYDNYLLLPLETSKVVERIPFIFKGDKLSTSNNSIRSEFRTDGKVRGTLKEIYIQYILL